MPQRPPKPLWHTRHATDVQPKPGEIDTPPIPDRLETSLFSTKKIPGGEPVITAPLSYALLQKHDTDLHFTMYSAKEQVRCTKGGSWNLRFDFCAYDLDFESHSARPTDDDFGRLVSSLDYGDYVPNWVYPTRGGARIIFMLDQPFADADEFEGHYQALLLELAEPLDHTPYKIDRVAKDWTRLYRAPRVVRDGAPTWDTPVYQFDLKPLDLRSVVAPKPKTKYVPPARKKTRSTPDGYLASTLKAMAEGNRNITVFKAVCWVCEHYAPAAAAELIEIIRDRAEAAGMDGSEFESTLQSAMKRS